MKKLLLCITAIVGISVHAQTPLHNTDWYLKKVVRNNITYHLPQNSEIGTPVLTFSPHFNSPPPPGSITEMKNIICGNTIWAIIYDSGITANSFSFWSKGMGNMNNCTLPENVAFYNQYIGYFSKNYFDYTYEITYSGGVKTLTLTDVFGEQAVYQYETLGTKEFQGGQNSQKVSIYPTPVKEGFVYLKNADRVEWIKIYNAEGKLILQDHYPDAKINVSNLLKGGYFMEVKSQSGISRHKLIKE